MLRDIEFSDPDPVINKILSIIGNGSVAPRHLSTGCYEITHFSADQLIKNHLVRDKNGNDFDAQFFDLGSHSSYGVADNPAQVLDILGEHLNKPGKYYCVFFTWMRKSEQSPTGGWRWHKWGEYIGTQDPQCEYLYDEPLIDEVVVYHVYQVKGPTYD